MDIKEVRPCLGCQKPMNIKPHQKLKKYCGEKCSRMAAGHKCTQCEKPVDKKTASTSGLCLDCYGKHHHEAAVAASNKTATCVQCSKVFKLEFQRARATCSDACAKARMSANGLLNKARVDNRIFRGRKCVSPSSQTPTSETTASVEAPSSAR